MELSSSSRPHPWRAVRSWLMGIAAVLSACSSSEPQGGGEALVLPQDSPPDSDSAQSSARLPSGSGLGGALAKAASAGAQEAGQGSGGAAGTSGVGGRAGASTRPSASPPPSVSTLPTAAPSSLAGAPTVGVPEASGMLGELDPEPPALPLAVNFTPRGGTFTDVQTVSLSLDTPGAVFHYTLDGSLPTAESPTYDRPIQLEQSTRLRVLARIPADDGILSSGPVAGQAYLRIAPDAAAFKSHLPVVVLHTWEVGTLDDSRGEPHVPATLHLFEPVSGVTDLLGEATLNTRIGIRVRGETSRGWPKKQHAVEFRDAADEDLDLPWLGMPAGSDWVISDPIAMDRSSIRNAFTFAVSNSIGRYAPRTRFVESFMVTSGGASEGGLGGDLAMGSFMGLYTVIEKIKRGKGRLDLAKLKAEDLAEPEMSGGYIIRLDKGETDFEAAGAPVQFVYPKPEVMQDGSRAPQKAYIQDFINDYHLAASAPDFRHPVTGKHYSEFIDQDAWIDYHIVSTLTHNPDAIRRSGYLHKDKGGKLTAGPLWDYDRAVGNPQDHRAGDYMRWSNGFNEPWWTHIFDDVVFQQRYQTRVLELLQNELSYPRLEALIDELVAEIGDAGQRNYERWPQESGTNEQPGDIAQMKEWLSKRVAWYASAVAEVPF